METPKVDMNILPPPLMPSQSIDTDSLIDLEDGTTVSYHTATGSRIDNGRQSIISIQSNEIIGTSHQPIIRDDLVNNITSPEGSFYYDAFPSPSQSQQTPSSTDEPNILIDNLTDLLEQIETYNRTNRQLLTPIHEEKSRLPPVGEETTIDNINQLITIVEDIHQYNQTKTSNTMDNLFFIYDDKQSEPSIDNLVEIVHSFNQTSSCVDNLLFVYDDPITPSDDESKQIANDSDEWSYDNLTATQDEQVDTDHLGTIVHEALAARFQKPIKFNPINEVEEPTSDLDTVADENLPTRSQESVIGIDHETEESLADTDHLGTIIHEDISARFQKPDQIEFEVFPDQLQELVDELTADTNNFDTIAHKDIAARFQRPDQIEKTDQLYSEMFPEESQEPNDELTVDTDSLDSNVYEDIAGTSQKPAQMETTDQIDFEAFPEESQEPIDTDNLGSSVYENISGTSQKPVQIDFEAFPEESQESIDTDNLGSSVYENIGGTFEKPINMETTDQVDFEVYPEELQELVDESSTDTDNLGTIINEALAARFQTPIKTKTTDQLYSVIFPEESLESIDTNNPDSIVHEDVAARFEIKRVGEFDDIFSTEESQEFIDEPTVDSAEHETSNKPVDEPIDNTHTIETIIYEIESSTTQPNLTIPDNPPPPVSNLSQIVSDSLLTSSNYHSYHHDENKIEFNITHQPFYDEEIYEEYGYRRTTTDPETEDIVEKFEELCQRYSINIDQYKTTAKQIDNEINQFDDHFHETNEQNLTTTSDTISEELITTIERIIDKRDETAGKRNETDEFYSIITVQRQANSFGKYGFDFEETFDGKIKISAIINQNYYPNLNIGDEIISINDNRTFKTREQCQLVLNSLWENFYENVQITIIRSANIPIRPSK
jgi:hypothetical protein